MEYEVIVSEDAENDLFDIYYYVAVNDSFYNADTLRHKLLEKVFSLEKFPNRGSKVAGIENERPDFLQIIFKPYIIYYKVMSTQVVILAILDGRREINRILAERFLDT